MTSCGRDDAGVAGHAFTKYVMQGMTKIGLEGTGGSVPMWILLLLWLARHISDPLLGEKPIYIVARCIFA